MKVFSNSAASLDGRLSTVRNDHITIGSQVDRRWMSVLRARADAVLVGGRTFRNWPLPLVEDPAIAVSTRQGPLVNAVMTRTGAGPRAGAFFEHPRTRVVFFGARGADLSGFPPGVATHRLPDEASVETALDILAVEYGVESLLVEGGGDLIFQLVRAGRLDEINVTLCPLIIGGRGATSLVDGAGFLAGELPSLHLVSTKVVEDEVFLRYELRSSPSPET